MTYYIATRADWSAMNEYLGYQPGRGVSRLNQKMSQTLRRAAMALGIKQNTKQGGRLEFYSVSEADYNKLADPEERFMNTLGGSESIRPLAYLKAQELIDTIDRVNASYPGRMDYKTHCKYEAEMLKSVSSLLTPLEADVKTVRAVKPPLAKNPYKVGDYICYDWAYGAPKAFRDYANVRVSRVSDTYVWLEVMRFKNKDWTVWSNTRSAVLHFNQVDSYGADAHCQDDHGHFIPFEGNESQLEWVPITDYKGKPVRRRWDQVGKGHSDSTKAGYCYSYHSRD